jgi:glutamate-1-semialdehyde 2,1-aminomutase
VNRIEDEYRGRTPESRAVGERAERVMPGGETRAAGWHDPYPLTIARGEGPYVFDVDGNRYIDLIGNYTSLVHGYGFPPILEAVRAQLECGTAWPARCEPQVELAELLCSRIASIDLLRFCNSGTEAALGALTIAKYVTGRQKILMARYGYHGQNIEHMNGLRGSDGPGTLVAPFNDSAAFQRVLAEHGDEIAAVFLEPTMGSAGVVRAEPSFLETVERATRDAGALFVVDEVITFRLDEHGAQSRYEIAPDLTMLGKTIGGGFPVGAFGGREDLMRLMDPRGGPLFHSGTFSGNPVTMAAGIASVSHLTADAIVRLDAMAANLADGLAKAAADAGLPFSLRRDSSLINVYFSDQPPDATIARTDAALADCFHLAALNHGLFFSHRGLLCVSTAFDDDVVTEAVERAASALSDTAGEAA